MQSTVLNASPAFSLKVAEAVSTALKLSQVVKFVPIRVVLNVRMNST